MVHHWICCLSRSTDYVPLVPISELRIPAVPLCLGVWSQYQAVESVEELQESPTCRLWANRLPPGHALVARVL
jgi:hypothetical protein